MRPAYLPSSYANRPTLGSRATSLAISAALVALLIWMLIRMGLLPDTLPNGRVGALTTITVQGDRPARAATKAIKATPKHQTTATTETKVTPPVPAPKVPPPPIPWNVIPMSHDDFVQSDIATKPNRAASGQEVEQTADKSAVSGNDNGTGGTPGDRIYGVDWYPRPPTRQELDFYIKKPPTETSWADIVCRTAPHYTVVDCRPLDESPNSGLAHDMVNASWQFHIMPPRVNGKMLLGVWVRVHYDYVVHEVPAP